MSQQSRWAGTTWLATAAIAGTFALSTATCAPTTYRSRGQTLYSGRSYDRLQQRSQELEMLAARSRDAARLDQRRGGRHEVTDRMNDFTRHAGDLRDLLLERGVPASKVNDRFRRLRDDGNKVQREWGKSRYRDPQMLADWDRVMAALSDLNSQFMGGNDDSRQPEFGVRTSGSFPDRDGRDRDDLIDARQLSQEMDRRATFAFQLAANENLRDVSNKIAEFREDFRDFDTKAGRMDRDERRDRLDHLLKDVQATQRDLAERRVSRDLVEQWNGVVELVVRLRDAS